MVIIVPYHDIQY